MNIDDYWLCVDCMFYAVNDDLPPDSNDERDMEILNGVHSLGPHLTPDFGDGEGEDDFSWKPCEACGSKLGGSRFRFTIIKEN